MHHAFCTFLCRRCTTTTWNCLIISRFAENLNTRQRLPYSFSELWYSPLKLISRKIHQHLTNWTRWIKFEAASIPFLSDVFVAVVVVVCLSSLIPCIGLQICNVRKQPTFRDASTRFSTRWRLRNRTSTEIPYWWFVTAVTRRLFCKSTRFEAFSNAG